MTATSAPGPRMVKGAFVSKAAGATSPTFVVYQYNPATLRRSVTPQMVGGETNDRSELVRFTGAPVETISLDIEIDAIDELSQSNPLAESSGIAPQLAALELLAYPSSSAVQARQRSLAEGTLEVAPMAAPAVHFVWGPKRVLPVRIDSFRVTEEQFDQQLNPIRATVGVSMRVLTYSDVAPDVSAYNDFLSYQRSLESLAKKLASNAAQTGVNPSSI